MRISDWSSDVCSSDLPTIKDMRDSMERRFTPETVWENVGASKTVGSEQALAFTDAFNAQMSVARADVIVHHIAAAGNAVLTERTDLFYNAAGETVFAIKLMGVLVMEGPKIIEWRDHVDTKGAGPQTER